MSVQSLTLRLQAALSQILIPQRCHDLTAIINDLSAKDASYVLRTIVESIFEVPRDEIEPSGHYAGGWGLHFINRTEHCSEFNALRTFLSPKGPLLLLSFRITNDPFQSFHFPIAWLPSKVRLEIQEGSATPFYSHKIQNLGPGKLPVHIMLNAFEFYVFHFAHFLLGNTASSSGGGSYWASTVECLYPTLVEDLLIAFMPLDASLPPGPSGIPITPRGVLLPQRLIGGTPVSVPNLNLSNLMSPILRPGWTADEVGNLLNKGSGCRMSGAYTSSPVVGSNNAYIHSHGEFSTWSSQVLLQILLEKWVNQCVTVQMKCTSSNVARHALYNSAQEIFVPSCDHIYVVRILLKHLHYFCNSIKPQQQLPLDQLRRNVWGMSRKIIYMFLKYLFLHWPLDSSFKLVLETWLSFIQPWRYTVYNPCNPVVGQSKFEAHPILERKWIAFISENLLFYTYLFELLLGRLLRLDLASAKNVQILFRVCKVFHQDKFIQFIEEIEETIGQNVHKSFLGDYLDSSKPATVPETSSFWSNSSEHMLNEHSIAQAARNHIVETEGQRHIYESLFSPNIIDKVQCLLKFIKKAEEAISEELSASKAKNASSGKRDGILTCVIKSFTVTPQTHHERQIFEEMQKTLTYLNLSFDYICKIFKVSPAAVTSFDSLDTSSGNFTNVPAKIMTVPDQILTEQGPVLSHYGQMQLLNGLKRFDIKYEGDPDLRPICSYEISFLVRFLYMLSTAINEKYELPMTRHYYRKDYLGNLARVFLQPPEIVYNYDKSQEGSRKKLSKTLSPRISLRPLANKMRFGLTLAFFIICWLLNVSSIRIFSHLLVPLFLAYVIGKALLEPASNRDLSLDVRSI